MFKRVPQVSEAFSTLVLDGGEWRKKNETSVKGDSQYVVFPSRVILVVQENYKNDHSVGGRGGGVDWVERTVIDYSAGVAEVLAEVAV